MLFTERSEDDMGGLLFPERSEDVMVGLLFPERSKDGAGMPVPRAFVGGSGRQLGCCFENVHGAYGDDVPNSNRILSWEFHGNFSPSSLNNHRTATEPPIERSGKVHWQPFRTFGRTGSGPVSLQVRTHNICDSQNVQAKLGCPPGSLYTPCIYYYPLPPTPN